MEIKEEGKKVLDAAEAKLAGLKEIVTRKGWTKWVIVALAVLVAVVAEQVSTAAPSPVDVARWESGPVAG